jgi:hypothetical protein
MEACLSAHFVSRTLRALGHEPRIIPAICVKPFVKGQKNDYNDAEAIAEAALRPNLRVVQEKSQDQLDLQARHRVRSRLVSRRTGAPLGCTWAAGDHRLATRTAYSSCALSFRNNLIISIEIGISADLPVPSAFRFAAQVQLLPHVLGNSSHRANHRASGTSNPPVAVRETGPARRRLMQCSRGKHNDTLSECS